MIVEAVVGASGCVIKKNTVIGSVLGEADRLDLRDLLLDSRQLEYGSI